MANKILIEGEKGIHGDISFRGDIIAKPMQKALDGYVKNEQLRTKNAAIKAGKVDEKAGKLLSQGVKGLGDVLGDAADKVVIEYVDAYRKNPTPETLAAAEKVVDATSFGGEFYLKENKKFEEIFGDDDGEIDIKSTPNLSSASSQTSINNAIGIFGSANGVTAEYNLTSGEYDHNVNGTIIGTGRIMDNIFAKNVKFNSMVLGEFNKQATSDMNGNSRRVNYDLHMNTKGQIVSAFHDPAVDDIPSVNKHLGNPTWAQVDHEDFDLNKVKTEVKKYYNEVLSSEQKNFQINKENKKKEGEENLPPIGTVFSYDYKGSADNYKLGRVSKLIQAGINSKKGDGELIGSIGDYGLSLHQRADGKVQFTKPSNSDTKADQNVGPLFNPNKIDEIITSIPDLARILKLTDTKQEIYNVENFKQYITNTPDFFKTAKF